MRLKNSAVVLATSIAFVAEISEHDRYHLHTHTESEHPVYNPTGINVYGIINNPLRTSETLSGFATLVTMQTSVYS